MGWTRSIALAGLLTGSLFASDLAAAEPGWRVTWTDWCYMEWARGEGEYYLPAEEVTTYTHPADVSCFYASLTGIGHELVFTASGGFLRDVSFWGPFFSGSVTQPLSSDGDDYNPLDNLHCSPLGECINWGTSEFLFTSALHVGSEPPAGLGVSWSGFTIYSYFPYYVSTFYRPVWCSTGGMVDPADAIPGQPFCAPGQMTIELLNQTTTPEPISVALLGSGLAGIVCVRRRRGAADEQRE